MCRLFDAAIAQAIGPVRPGCLIPNMRKYSQAAGIALQSQHVRRFVA